MANAREIYHDLREELKHDRLLTPKFSERLTMLNNLFANAQDGIRAAQRNRNLRSAERREVFNINLQLLYLKGKQALIPPQRPKTS